METTVLVIRKLTPEDLEGEVVETVQDYLPGLERVKQLSAQNPQDLYVLAAD